MNLLTVKLSFFRSWNWIRSGLNTLASDIDHDILLIARTVRDRAVGIYGGLSTFCELLGVAYLFFLSAENVLLIKNSKLPFLRAAATIGYLTFLAVLIHVMKDGLSYYDGIYLGWQIPRILYILSHVKDAK